MSIRFFPILFVFLLCAQPVRAMELPAQQAQAHEANRCSRCGICCLGSAILCALCYCVGRPDCERVLGAPAGQPAPVQPGAIEAAEPGVVHQEPEAQPLLDRAAPARAPRSTLARDMMARAVELVRQATQIAAQERLQAGREEFLVAQQTPEEIAAQPIIDLGPRPNFDEEDEAGSDDEFMSVGDGDDVLEAAAADELPS